MGGSDVIQTGILRKSESNDLSHHIRPLKHQSPWFRKMESTEPISGLLPITSSDPMATELLDDSEDVANDPRSSTHGSFVRVFKLLEYCGKSKRII